MVRFLARQYEVLFVGSKNDPCHCHYMYLQYQGSTYPITWWPGASQTAIQASGFWRSLVLKCRYWKNTKFGIWTQMSNKKFFTEILLIPITSNWVSWSALRVFLHGNKFLKIGCTDFHWLIACQASSNFWIWGPYCTMYRQMIWWKAHYPCCSGHVMFWTHLLLPANDAVP